MPNSQVPYRVIDRDQPICRVLEVNASHSVVECENQIAILIPGKAVRRPVKAGKSRPILELDAEKKAELKKDDRIVVFVEQSYGVFFVTDWAPLSAIQAAEKDIREREIKPIQSKVQGALVRFPDTELGKAMVANSESEATG